MCDVRFASSASSFTSIFTKRGLVEYVVPPEELASSVSPAALAETKRMVYAQLSQSWPEALRDADTVQCRVVEQPDAVEGARALIERRAPRFNRLGRT